MLCFLMMSKNDNPIPFNLYSEYTYVMKYVLFLNFTPNHFVIILIFSVAKSLVVCVVVCGSLFIIFVVDFLLAVVLPVLRIRASDWPSDI